MADNNANNGTNKNAHLGTEISLEETKQMEEDAPPAASAGQGGKPEKKDKFQSVIQRRKTMMLYSVVKLDQYIQQSQRKDLGALKSSIVVAAAPSLESLEEEAAGSSSMSLSSSSMPAPTEKALIDQRMEFFTKKMITEVKYSLPLEVRMKNVTFQTQIDPASTKIQTVYNSSFLYAFFNAIKQCIKGESRPPSTTKYILQDINLCLKPGKMYLVLGSPGSGKSSLLKAIAGRLTSNGSKVNKSKNGPTLTGTISYNGKTLDCNDHQYHIDNAVAYIDQLDRHAPRYTVEETFEFANQCKTGGVDNTANKEDKDDARSHPPRVTLGLELLGLTAVKDTFVGDDNIRGVSGGQRRRVTVGEMLMDVVPLLCGDEISTGLDAASTFNLVDVLAYYGRLQNSCRIIALLQPSPESVSCFDEVIVLADEGQVLFAGPIEEVQQYFENLGYHPPDQMDVADFLQLLSTPDANTMWTAPPGSDRTTAYSVPELAAIFKQSSQNQKILQDLEAPLEYVWDSSQKATTTAIQMSSSQNNLSQWEGIKRKYANSFPRATWLNLKRSLTLWIRDRRVLIANSIKNAVMGVSVGGVFFQTTDVVSILGVLFQAMLFIMLGACTAAPALVDDRVIFRKHYEANFFSAYPFLFGRAISQMPQTLMDVLMFGTWLYFMVGLNLAVISYILFIVILFTFSILMNQIMAVFAASLSSKDSVQVVCSVLLLFGILFGGFIVPPDVIPVYYVWIYWMNPFAWAYRALLCLEFYSESWEAEGGAAIMTQVGFILPNGEAYGVEWLAFWFAYMVPLWLVCIFVAAWSLGNIAPSGGSKGASNTAVELDDNRESTTEERVNIPFVPATVTFEDICYDVKASTGNDILRLLDNVNGKFEAGRMVALMGSSGAGKTTLMDTIALRKASGKVSGEVRINGFLQEKDSFRRASGYVEQFDVQSAELTVRETVLYSAFLRLGEEQVKTDEEKTAFVDALLKTLELQPFADSLVGTSVSGGLTFEQKKRLSIAVELAASPSIVFLDEPTSGLDARAALLVVKLLRKIATEGRTICATIHQPSSGLEKQLPSLVDHLVTHKFAPLMPVCFASRIFLAAVFEMFDDLLLLKKGGRVVYFGELGEQSRTLTRYFESCGAKPIDRGENPANWVLTVMSDEGHDYAEEYIKSDLYKKIKADLTEAKTNPDISKKITYKAQYAASLWTRSNRTNRRLMTIYWRSPNYNLARIMVSAVIALIMGTILIKDRFSDTFTETEMRAQFAIIFLAFIIVGIMSIFSVLPVMLSIRDMFHRHRTAGMLGPGSLTYALAYSEKWFLLFTSFIFCLIFLAFSMTSKTSLRAPIAFWGFFTFNMALYSYFGQAFVCFFQPMATAQILSSVFIGLNNFFSGLIVRPQFMTGIFAITYWITPGHYVYEGMITSMYAGDTRAVVADNNSDFWDYLGCTTVNVTSGCTGDVEDYVQVFYGGKFQVSHIPQNLFILGGYLVLARFMTFLALYYINFSNT